MRCPKCGSDKGWYTTGLFYQYYDMHGNPDGCHTDNFESAMAKCIRCGKRMKLDSILNQQSKVKPSRKYMRKCGICNLTHDQKEMMRTNKSPNGWMCYNCYDLENTK